MCNLAGEQCHVLGLFVLTLQRCTVLSEICIMVFIFELPALGKAQRFSNCEAHLPGWEGGRRRVEGILHEVKVTSNPEDWIAAISVKVCIQSNVSTHLSTVSIINK